MAINVTVANNQAAQINSCIQQLRRSQTQLKAYKSSIQSSWSGKEVSYILTSIDQTLNEINVAINEMEGISRDIKTNASNIKREEDAAAAAARAQAEKQRRIRVAQNAYNNACNKVNELEESFEELQKKYDKAPFWEKIALKLQLDELEEKLEAALKVRNQKYNNLRAARR